MVMLFTESILWLMDWAPLLLQQNQDLDEAFPEPTAPLSGIKRTNLYSWCGLLPDKHLPPFWSVFIDAKSNGV